MGIARLGTLVRLGVAAAVLGLAAAPLQAKTFRINIEADPAQMDPITVSELISGEILKQMYEGWTTPSADGRNQPMLATSWDPLADGKGFRFHLRPGVRFHSGRPFTAKDVKYTYQAMLKPGAQAGLAADYLKNIVGAADYSGGKAAELAGVNVIDDLTLDVHFVKPDVLFPIYPVYFLDSGAAGEGGADWMTKASAGTGPYRFKSWKRGVAVELAANPDYWGGAPKIDGVQFLIVPTGDTALSQYDAGELDFMRVPENTYRRVLQDARYKDQIGQVPRAQARYLGLNQALYAPFKDKRVREAVSLSLDRTNMIRGLYNGAAFPLNGQVTPGTPGYNPDLPALKYDPTRAKALMAEAGFPDGKGLPPVDIQSTEPSKDEITYYASQLNKVLGMPVSVKTVERATFIKSMNSGQVPFFSWAWTADYPDAYTFLEEMWYSKSPFNRPRWSNAEFDRLIEAAGIEPDDAKRFQLYHQAETVLMDDWGAIPTLITAAIYLRKPNVRNVALTPFGLTLFQPIQID